MNRPFDVFSDVCKIQYCEFNFHFLKVILEVIVGFTHI